MIKKIVAAVLIVLSAGGWFYLDYLNKQEQKFAEQSRIEMQQARAKAQARAADKAKFETQIMADLTACKAVAEKAKEEYLTQHQKPARKKGEFTVPQESIDEAAKILDAANATCQATYTTRLSSGS
ncbi:MAG: hypothetical protein Q8O24_03700 [Gallionellaceae bacterium]|nr:hypothetical protein [Gallionellaceae bacterium]